MVKCMGSGSDYLDSILALALASTVTLRKLLNFSGPQFPYGQSAGLITLPWNGCKKTLHRACQQVSTQEDIIAAAITIKVWLSKTTVKVTTIMTKNKF